MAVQAGDRYRFALARRSVESVFMERPRRRTAAVRALLPGLLSVAPRVQGLVLTAALVGLGTGIHLPTLRRTGGRALALGGLSWLLVAGVAYLGVRLAG